jgi:hypothetical protein
MKSRIPVRGLHFIFIICWLVLQGCSKYHVTTSQKNPGDISYKKKVAATYLWGIINKPHTIVDTACGTAGLAEVKITTNPGYTVLSVVTLGIVNLIKVEWKCQKEPPIIGP